MISERRADHNSDSRRSHRFGRPSSRLVSDMSDQELKPCPCRNWCWTVNLQYPTNHHHLCEHYDDSLISVWRVEYDGQSYVTDEEPVLGEDLCGGETVTKDVMHKEVYEQLSEFEGF